MKKLVSLLIFSVFVGNTLFSQFNESPIIHLENEDKKLLNWGFFLGFNQYDFKFSYHEYNLNDNKRDVLVEKTTGFNLGLIGELRLNNHFDLRFEPGLYYTQRNLGFPGFYNEQDYLREVTSTYLHFPLLLKASTKRLGNFKPYIVGGLSASINISNNEESALDNSEGVFRMRRNTYYYEVGFGIDFYLYYFKFSPSIRGVFAITDDLVPDINSNSPWTSNIDKMQTRAVFVNFTFE